MMEKFNRHMPEHLKQMQSLSLEEKIELTQERLNDWCNAWKRFEIVNENTGKVRYEAVDCREGFAFAAPMLRKNEFDRACYDNACYLALSGGKDSTVLDDICQRMGLDIPRVFSNTGLEYTQIQKFAREKGAEFVQPEMRFTDVISTYGYPIIGKEVAEAIYYARRIRSQNGNVERERERERERETHPARTSAQKRGELNGLRTLGGCSETSRESNCKADDMAWDEPPRGLTWRNVNLEPTTRRGEWVDWRRGCL